MESIRGITGPAQNLANLGLGQAGATLSGAYLDPRSNPWLSATYEQASRPVVSQYMNAIAPSIMAEAGRRGMYGSSAMDEVLGQSRGALGTSLQDLATDIYGGNYQQERSRQGLAWDDLPKQDSGEHNALADAQWTKAAWNFLFAEWERQHDESPRL